MTIKKLAPSPRDSMLVSSPRSHHPRSPTRSGGGGGDDDAAAVLSPRSMAAVTTTTTTTTSPGMNVSKTRGGESNDYYSSTTSKSGIRSTARLSPEMICTHNTNTNKLVKNSMDPAQKIRMSSANEDNEEEDEDDADTPTILTEVPPPTRRSKRMLVIDPKSGRKYHLHDDDHSLTDKELHVYHRHHRTKTTTTSPPSSMMLPTNTITPITTSTTANPTMVHAMVHPCSPPSTQSPSIHNTTGNITTTTTTTRTRKISSLFVKTTNTSSKNKTLNTTTTKAVPSSSPSSSPIMAPPPNTLLHPLPTVESSFDDDLRTYNSTPAATAAAAAVANNTNSSSSFQMSLFNDDTHTLETASALTEVSYYDHHDNNGKMMNPTTDSFFRQCGKTPPAVGFLLSSRPFDCMLPNPSAEFNTTTNTNLDEERVLPFSMTNTKKGEEEERRDDIESVERWRYSHPHSPPLCDAIDESPAKNTKEKTKNNPSSKNNTSTIVSGCSDPSPTISSVFHAMIDSPRIFFSGFFNNRHPLSPHGGGGGVGVVDGSMAVPTEQTTIHPQYYSSEILSFRRVVCMVVFPKDSMVNGIIHENNHHDDTTLLGMKFVQSSHDFQAHVRYVQRGSKAERMGVQRGDIVSFAVALSNMTEEQNCFLAEKLIKRLESVGMRTSYRELYDIFLSKTTHSRPIGMVFRRWKNRSNCGGVSSSSSSGDGGGGGGGGGGLCSPNHGAFLAGTLPTTTFLHPSLNDIYITNEFEWSTDFLQCLSIKCREYEFDVKVPFHTNRSTSTTTTAVKKIDKTISFMPRPNVEIMDLNNHCHDPLSNFLSDIFDKFSLGYNNDGLPSSPLATCLHSSLAASTAAAATKGTNEITENRNRQKENADFLSNRVLCSLVEQSMGLIFLHRLSLPKKKMNNNNDRSGDTVGSGFALMRKPNGSWSAPCFLTILGSKDEFTETITASTSSAFVDDVKMVIIHKKTLINALIGGDPVKFHVRKEERAHVMVRDFTVIGVREGRFQLSTDFYLAIKVNDEKNQGAFCSFVMENPSSNPQITALDILTGTISPPDQSVDFYGALQSLELPYSMHSHPVVPDILQRYSDSDWVEFLPDNGSFASSCGMRTKLEMITQRHATSPDDLLELDIFARKFKYYLMDGVPVHRLNFSSSPTGVGGGGVVGGTIEEKVLRLTIKDPNCIFTSSLELTRRLLPGVCNVGVPSNFSTTLESITKMSRTPPVGMNGLDEDERKRFFSIETDLSPGPIYMLAKSKKDVMILLCGMKLLLEMERMAQG